MPKKIPAPFKRPSINLEETGRTWQHVPAPRVVPGDIVADLGLIQEVRHERGMLQDYVRLTNRFGDSKQFTALETVFAFVTYSSLAE